MRNFFRGMAHKKSASVPTWPQGSTAKVELVVQLERHPSEEMFGLGLSNTTIEDVKPLSPAARCGLRPGDRITSIQGQDGMWYSGSEEINGCWAKNEAALSVRATIHVKRVLSPQACCALRTHFAGEDVPKTIHVSSLPKEVASQL